MDSPPQFILIRQQANSMLSCVSLALSLVVAISADSPPAYGAPAPAPSYAPAPAPSYAPAPTPAYHAPVEKEVKW